MAGSRQSRRSLLDLWLAESAHPLIAIGVALALEAAAVGGLIWWAGWRGIVHALAIENAEWFGLCAIGQIVAYIGYAVAFRGIASVDKGVRLEPAVALGVVSVGFSPVFSANAAGGFSIDLVSLREAGLSRKDAFRRVVALSALEYAVLAPAVAVCGVLLLLGITGHASAGTALPWLLVVPGAVVAAWLTQPERAQRYAGRESRGRIAKGFGHGVAALTLLRRLLLDRGHRGIAFAGAGLYWAGDMATLWAALRIFDVRLSIPVLVLAYGTGWALTRRSLPFGGPGVVEILLAYVLTWFHLRFANAAAGVVGYRLFNLWFALLPAGAVLPFASWFERHLVRSPKAR